MIVRDDSFRLRYNYCAYVMHGFVLPVSLASDVRTFWLFVCLMDFRRNRRAMLPGASCLRTCLYFASI